MSGLSRVQITERTEPYLVEIRMPGPRSRRATWLLPYSVLYAAGMLVVDLLAGRVVYANLAGADYLGGALTLLVLLFLFGTMNVVAFGAVAWSAYRLWGTENASFDGYTLRMSSGVGPFGRNRSFAREEVRELRLSPMSGGEFHVRTLGRNGIVFDAGGKPRSFGAGLTAEEAGEVLAALRNAFVNHSR